MLIKLQQGLHAHQSSQVPIVAWHQDFSIAWSASFNQIQWRKQTGDTGTNHASVEHQMNVPMKPTKEQKPIVCQLIKFKRARLGHEVTICVQTGEIVLINSLRRCGLLLDVNILTMLDLHVWIS